jgi:hypothetical protein
MTRMRVYGILADYADQNDHDVLRSDPIFKLLCDRSIEADDLASQPTLSRFENAIDVRSFNRLRDRFLDQFIATFKKLPRHLTLCLSPRTGRQFSQPWATPSEKGSVSRRIGPTGQPLSSPRENDWPVGLPRLLPRPLHQGVAPAWENRRAFGPVSRHLTIPRKAWERGLRGVAVLLLPATT